MSPKQIWEQAGSCRVPGGAPVTDTVRDKALLDEFEKATEDKGCDPGTRGAAFPRTDPRRIRKRCPDRRADDLGAFGGEAFIEPARVFRVAVPD